MTERERLRKLILKSEILCDTCGESTNSYCAEYLADYLIANGVIVPPVRIGDYVYFLYECDDEPCGYAVSDAQKIMEAGQKHFWGSQYIIPQDDLSVCIPYLEIGKTVFLTREEAERALRKEDEGK